MAGAGNKGKPRPEVQPLTAPKKDTSMPGNPFTNTGTPTQTGAGRPRSSVKGLGKKISGN